MSYTVMENTGKVLILELNSRQKFGKGERSGMRDTELLEPAQTT